MFDYVPENYTRKLALCAAHFTKDSFQKLNVRFNKKLLLKHEVPTLKPDATVVGPQTISRLNNFKCISDVMF